MAEDMFDNGSFLRRRKRYKRPSFPGHWSNMLDPYTRKLLSQYTFQHMHGNSGPASHVGPHGHAPHPVSHQPPPHPSSHLHPGLLPHPMLMSGSNSHQSLGSCNNGELSPTNHHNTNLPINLNIPTQNHMMPPHPMIAAAARAAQLVNFPIRPPPPPCSVGFPAVTLPLNNPSSIKSPRRPSPENSPLEQSGLSSPTINSSYLSPLSSFLSSSRQEDIISNTITSSNVPITKSTMRSSKGSGFTIDNIIGDQRKSDSSNNNNTVNQDENCVEEKENEERVDSNSSSAIQSNTERKDIGNEYNKDSNIQKTEVIKIEKAEEDSEYKIEKDIEKTNLNSSCKTKNYEGPTKQINQLHSTSNLPSFLQCAMLGKMVTTSQHDILKDTYQDREKYKKASISPIHLQTSHYQTTASDDAWK